MRWQLISSNIIIEDDLRMESAVIGDVNNDGFNDIVLANSGPIDTTISDSDPRPVVLLNRGDGTFFNGTSSVFAATPSVQGWVNDTIIDDFNGDNKNDVLFIDHGREVGGPPYGGFFNTLYLSSPSGLTNQTNGISQNQSFWHGAQNAADVDGDGDLDFAAAALDAEIIDLFINDGAGRFSNESISRLPDYVTTEIPASGNKPLNAGTVAFLDANGDGHQDLITAPYSNLFPDFSEALNFHILLNDGQGNFTNGEIKLDARPGGLPDYYGYQSIHVGDFDGNGLDDFIAVSEVNTGASQVETATGSYVSYYMQTSAGVFTDVTPQSFAGYFIGGSGYDRDAPSNYSLNELFLGDIDGDGDLDLMQPYLFASPENISTSIYVNEAGVFTPFIENTSFRNAENSLGQTFPRIETGSSRLLLGDVNNDGVGDVISITSVFETVTPTADNPYGLGVTIDVIASGRTATVPEIEDGVYRFYNSSSGTHFYSASQAEAQSIADNLAAFSFEGTVYKTIDASDTNAVELYRFFNSETGAHFYTSSAEERDSIISQQSAFQFEGVAYHIHQSADADDVALHRFYNTQTATHFYTANETEKDGLINTVGSSYQYEGVIGYVDPI